jgi:hypothetical protein
MTTAATSNPTPDLLTSAMRGALAGAVGCLALKLVEQGERRTFLPLGSDMTSTAARAVNSVAEDHGRSPSRAQAEVIGGTLEVALCAALGAVFGIVHSRVKPPALVHGLVLAGLSYAATSSSKGLLPRLGIPSPMDQTVEEAIVPMAAHLAFGVTTAAVFEATS